MSIHNSEVQSQLFLQIDSLESNNSSFNDKINLNNYSLGLNIPYSQNQNNKKNSFNNSMKIIQKNTTQQRQISQSMKIDDKDLRITHTRQILFQNKGIEKRSLEIKIRLSEIEQKQTLEFHSHSSSKDIKKSFEGYRYKQNIHDSLKYIIKNSKSLQKNQKKINLFKSC